MRKLMIPILFLGLFVLIPSAYSLTLKIDPPLVDPGRTNTFDVVIEDAVDLGAFQFDLTYNPAIMTIDINDVILGDIWEDTERTVWDPFKDIDNDSGRLTFGAFTSGDAKGPAGDGVLARIMYTSLSDVEGTLAFDDTKTWIVSTEQDPEALPRVLKPSLVTPTCEITVTPGENGTITPFEENNVVLVQKDGEQAFDITPDDCYEIASVTINGTLLDSPVSSYTFENVTCGSDSGETYSIAAEFAIKQFTVTPEAGDGGTISPAEAQTVDCGSDMTVTITPDRTTPDQCYHIANVVAGGVSVGAVSSYTFEDISEDQTITASFAINNCNITPTAGENGSISPSDPVTLVCNPQTFNFIPDEGYSVGNVVVNGVSKGPLSSYTFDTCETGSQTIHATFVSEYFTIRVCPNDGGRIHQALSSRPDGDVRVPRGSEPLFEIVPDECYDVSDVLVVSGVMDCSEVSEDQLVLQDVEVEINPNGIGYFKFPPVTQDFTIKPVFAAEKHTIEASADQGGNISPSGSVEVECGKDQIFEITPDDCYQIADVLVDGESVGNVSAHTFTNVRGDGHTIHAKFEKIPYVITATYGKNGDIDPSGDVTVLCGEDQLFKFIPKDDEHPVTSVIVNGKPVLPLPQGEYLFENVREDHNRIHVSFEGDDTITAIVAGNDGQIDPSGEVPMTEGGNQTFTITEGALPLLYLLVDGVRVDAVVENSVAEYTFEMVREGHTIIAVFEEVVVTANAGENGKIEPSNEVGVPLGQNQVFTITPDSCYQIAEVTVDGSPVADDDIEIDASGAGTYVFEKVVEDGSISVTFERMKHTIQTQAGDGGSISEAVEVECGSDATVTMTPDTCYQIAEVTVDGSVVDIEIDDLGAGTYVFEGVVKDGHSIAASFQGVTTIPGDVNDNGAVDLADAILAAKVACGIGPITVEEGDRNGDDKLGMEDALSSLQSDDTRTPDLKDTVSVLKAVSGADGISQKITCCADVNGNLRIGMEEVVYVLKHILEQQISPIDPVE